MTRLHLRQHHRDREHRTVRVTPESAGWDYVGFDLYRLSPGESAAAETGDREVCLVFVSGRARVEATGEDLGVVGGRMSPFDGKPWSVYVPAGSAWKIKAETDCEVAACSSPGVARSRPPRLIGPHSHTVMTRGKGNNVRYVTDIINETDPADSLLVVEVFMASSAATLALMPTPFITLFTSDAGVIAIGTRLLAVAAAFQLFDGLQVATTGALRGLGETRMPMLVSLFGYWISGLPLGWYLCFRAGYGVIGLWLGLAVSLLVVGTVLMGLWHVRIRETARRMGA